MEHPKHLALYARVLGSTGERLEFLGSLPAQLQPFSVSGGLLTKFLAPGLYRKILLCERNFGLARVAVLGDQITGKPRQLVIVHDLYGTLATADRFADAGKVMPCRVARGLTRGHRALYRLFKTAPLAVTQQGL